MRQTVTAEEKYNEMIFTPVPKLVTSLAVPTIISMLITSIYNMADTFFVSQIGTSASGAVGISFALMAVIQAIGFTFGIGAGNYISRLLGQKERQQAAKVAATSFFTALGLGVVLALLGLLFLDPLVYALGATETIAPYAKDYMGYILIGMPYMIASFVLNHTLRFQGSAYFAMLGIGTGGLLNIVLDPIFIFKLKMGTGGAALATIISQFISFCILYFYSGSGGNLKVRFKDFTPKWEIYKEILKGGIPSFNRQALASVAMIALNQVAGPFGDAAIAAMSIAARIFQFAVSVILGYGQGYQPVCGFNYGAKRYDRVLEAFWFCLKTSLVIMVVTGAVMFVLSTQIISLFRKEDLEVIAIGSRALRFQSVIFPLSAWIIMINITLQTIGKGMGATILSVSRQGLFFLPAVFILPRLYGITGLQLCQPVADIFTFLVAFLIGVGMLRELRFRQEGQKEEEGQKEQSGRRGFIVSTKGALFEMTKAFINRIISILYRYDQYFFARKLQEYSLPIDVGHIPSLMQVYRNPGITQSGIALNSGMDKGTVARSLKQLEKAGLVLRQTDENDRRVNHIFATQKGNEIKEKVFQIIEELHEVLYRGFDPQEIQQAFSFIERMRGNMEHCIREEK